MVPLPFQILYTESGLDVSKKSGALEQSKGSVLTKMVSRVTPEKQEFTIHGKTHFMGSSR